MKKKLAPCYRKKILLLLEKNFCVTRSRNTQLSITMAKVYICKNGKSCPRSSCMCKTMRGKKLCRCSEDTACPQCTREKTSTEYSNIPEPKKSYVVRRLSALFWQLRRDMENHQGEFKGQNLEKYRATMTKLLRFLEQEKPTIRNAFADRGYRTSGKYSFSTFYQGAVHSLRNFLQNPEPGSLDVANEMVSELIYYSSHDAPPKEQPRENDQNMFSAGGSSSNNHHHQNSHAQN